MQQLEIFAASPVSELESEWRASGLHIMPDFVSAIEEQALLESIDRDNASHWSSELQRRVQHYGYRYEYKRARLSVSDEVDPMPAWSLSVAGRLVETGLFPRMPDQMIVNEYLPGQGISAHIDRPDCFDDVVASISLGSDAVMIFSDGDNQKAEALLTQRSVVAITGLARYKWSHRIPARVKDNIQGRLIPRRRRISLTFRNVIRST